MRELITTSRVIRRCKRNSLRRGRRRRWRLHLCSKVSVTGRSILPSCSPAIVSSEHQPMRRAGRHLPHLARGPGVHLPIRFLALSLLLFATLGRTGLAVEHQRDREARVEASLAAADVALSRALVNPGTAMSSITEAETAVATARKSGATGDAMVRREQELARVRD